MHPFRTSLRCRHRHDVPEHTLLALVVCAAAAAAGCGGPRKDTRPQPSLEHMVFVPAGEFTMGRDHEDSDESPVRRVWLDAFYIDRTEVTNAQFKAFCDATGRLYTNNPHWDDDYFLGKPDYPVINITYDQARAYCAWANKRLPTEAEWEKAARGTEGQLYPWGNEWTEQVANLWGDQGEQDHFRRTAPVGSFPAGASPYGAVDMVGNVWEWCADWFDEDYYSRAPNRNPPGPAEPTPWRVVRGGGFSSPLRPTGDTVVSNRSKNHPMQPIHHLGCRCAWSPADASRPER
ncbi:MAG: formylglycine-generating enzyme family protein [Candidatus Krumholzibacteriia bacterium]